MVLEIKTVRYVHKAGHTDVCFGNDNSILTCGSDGNIRIFENSEDEDPSSQSVSEETLAVVFFKDQYLVGTVSNYVQAFTYPENIRDEVIFRFSAPVTHIAVSSSSRYLAACSCDMEIQVLDTLNNKITTLIGHTAPILGVSLDPSDEFLVSSSCDGSVKIWCINSKSIVKTLSNVLPVTNDFFKAISLGRTAWKSISGSVLVVPQNLEVVAYQRNTWNEGYRLSSENIEKSLSAVLFSPCGSYIAAASTSGDIIIWEVKNKTEVCYFKDPNKVGISGFAWHPGGSEIAFTDRLGRLRILADINDQIIKHVTQKEDNFSENATLNDEGETNILFESIDIGNNYSEGNNDGDDENCISLDKIKESYQNELEVEEPGSPSSIMSDKTSKEPPIVLPTPQPPFQPASTPSHFEPRCLCYNSIGMVRYYESDVTIDVQFHDSMFHHAIFLRTFGICTMASLSMKVLCLAVPCIDENLSKLSCVPLSSWDGSKDWTVYMPEKEEILALAASGDWVAIATNANQIRIFTHAGTQKQVVSLPGPVVCMSGFGETILVVYHMGLGMVDSQNQGFILLKVTSLSVKAISPFQPLPLFPKSVLKWAGFTDEGTPATFDSEGVLRLLGHDLLHWEVACDTKNHKKSPNDNYFIVGLSEKYQNVRCILCRNSHYPLMINAPTIIEIPLQIPLCALDSEKSTHEETFWRLLFSLRSLLNVKENQSEYENEISSFEQTIKQTALKLFAEACRNSEDVRALDIATFMSSHPLEVATKYAVKVGKMYLAEKLKKITPSDRKNQNSILENNSSEDNESENVDGSHNAIYSQQDLFENHSGNKEKENKEAKTNDYSKESHSSGSTEAIKTNSINPFKKVKEQSKEEPKGLKFFDALTKELPKKNKQENNKLTLNKPLKLKTLTKEKKTETTNKKPSFVQWFSTQKAPLMEEHPNLGGSDLTKLGMKIYKEMIKEGKFEDNMFESKKRNREEEDQSNNKKSKNTNDSF